VEGERFRYLCDASEVSWQLCRKFIDGLQEPERYVIKEFDDSSYCVLNRKTKQVVHTVKVKHLV